MRPASQASCAPMILRGLYPPIWLGATPPVSLNRRTQPITVLTATPNCDAARCRDSPPVTTAPTTRSRRSIEYGFAIHADLHFSQHLESHQSQFGNPLDSNKSHTALVSAPMVRRCAN